MSKINDVFWDPKKSIPPKIKRVVLSYNSYAKHFEKEKEKKRLKTTPDKVFEGWKVGKKKVPKKKKI
jgi:hypothetical protein